MLGVAFNVELDLQTDPGCSLGWFGQNSSVCALIGSFAAIHEAPAGFMLELVELPFTGQRQQQPQRVPQVWTLMCGPLQVRHACVLTCTCTCEVFRSARAGEQQWGNGQQRKIERRGKGSAFRGEKPGRKVLLKLQKCPPERTSRAVHGAPS